MLLYYTYKCTNKLLVNTNICTNKLLTMENKYLNERLLLVMDYLLTKDPKKFKTRVGVANFIGYPQSNLSSALKGNERYLTEGIVKRFCDSFPELSFDWLMHGKGEMLLSKYQKLQALDNLKIDVETTTEYRPTPQKFADKKYKKEVTIIPAKAQLGLKSYLYPDEMMNDLEKKIITVDQDYKGNYYEIECVGESMFNPTNPNSIREGDSVLCREISKMHWHNPFHKNDWEFVFFHNEFGIIIKKIKDQDLTNGNLTLCSYNEDKEEFPDFTINIRDCYAICNVVQVTQNRAKRHVL